MLGLCIASFFGGCSSAPEKVDVKALLPESLISPDGNLVSRETLRGKFVGLYFSAGWCPPCRAFTPLLIKFRNDRVKQFEVVLIGMDKSAKEQQAYVANSRMPWPALPYQDGGPKKLQSLFGVRSIPALIVVSPEGLVVSTRGHEEISQGSSSIFEDWIAKASGS